jgi:zinc/manganese transport system substrate-binding protein
MIRKAFLKSVLLATSLFAAIIAATIAALGAPSALAAVKVVATTPDIAWAVQEIGKDKVEVHALLKGTENPHFADAVPEFIRLAADADMVCLVGLELEVGWLPKVLSRAGNAQVQPNGKGYCDLGKKVSVLERPTGQVNRSMGDVHPFGNPHYWLSPVAFAEAAQVIADTLTELDPANAAAYASGYAGFKDKMNKILSRNKAKLVAFLKKNSGPHYVEYHREFVYLADAYGLKSSGSIEEKPGVLPSAGRITTVALSSKNSKLPFALAAEYNPKNVMNKFHEFAEIPVITIPTMIHTAGPIKDYAELQDFIIDSIAKASAGTNPAAK